MRQAGIVTYWIRTFLTSLICIVTLSFGASAAIRPEIGQPLQDALKLAAAHDYDAAMARVDAAAKVANKSDEETGTIEQVRKYLIAIDPGHLSLTNPARSE
jgi:hypothetical protein